MTSYYFSFGFKKVRTLSFFLLALVFFFLDHPAYAQQQVCNSWLNVQGVKSGVSINGLHVTGDQLTVECLFNRTAPFDPMSQGGDLVSKHCDPTNVNYLLRPYSAQITTDQGGLIEATDLNGPASISLNVTYHVAMVYDGSTLTLYRDGVLIRQVPASGNLVTNALQTRIGTEACLESPWPLDFIGYINEVRIWNVARTQAEIQSNMYSLLPNPPAQTGLLCYLTFNTLNNKQGDPFLGGSLFGNASIRQTNPNDNHPICETEFSIACNSYLNVQAAESGVSIGDLDITGNQLTVEAVFNRTQAYDPQYFGGDLVSKHCNPSDLNYMLRPNQIGISTVNALGGFDFYSINVPCSANLNTNYHVALVYDGSTLRFYRDGDLIGQTAASGNLITNNWPTRIGTEGCAGQIFPIDFRGYINEVRIWNVARTQQQLQQYRNAILPNPTTQTGLQAYYTFDGLQNKQGNGAWDATLFGSAAINQTNTKCFVGGEACFIETRKNLNPTPEPTKPDITSPIITGHVMIYPNPAKEFVMLSYTAPENGMATIKIIDATGRIAMLLKRPVATRNNTINVNVNGLGNGLYIVQIIVNKQVQTKKLIIKHN